jgi:hypothetical protein
VARYNRTFLVLLVAALGAALAVPTTALAGAPVKKSTGKMYRWVDKQGVVHYGDKIPPEYADQDKEQIDKQGHTIRTIEGAMTPEEIAAAEKKKQEEAAAASQRENDKILLSTYGSVEAIERARDQRIAAIHGEVQMASTTVTTIEKEIARLETQRGKTKDPKAVERIDAQIATQRRELTANQRHVVTRQGDLQNVRAQFDSDIARFKVLTNKGAAPAAAPATKH